jgi:hypothetical protein
MRFAPPHTPHRDAAAFGVAALLMRRFIDACGSVLVHVLVRPR